jgi:phytoene dehydrogenase-like protein
MLWLASLTAQPVDAPYTGILAYSIAYGRQQNSWATPEGGSGALPQALKRLITENGGKILTGKQVTELILEDGHCRGVRTADGASYQAEKAVVSTIHIRQLVDMAPAEAWGQDFVDYISGWQSGFTYFVAHYATNEPPQFLINGEYRTCSAAGIAGSTDNLIQLMADMRKGVIHHDTPILLVACPSLVDPSRAPAGKHTVRVMSVFPYDLKDGGPERWDEIKNDVAAKDLQYLRNFVPNLTDDVILGKYVDSPLDLERRNLHNWRGSGHGGEATPAQSGAMRPAPGWATYRMPIPGLYQTGATTHPGGSVSAAPGRNAAWVILEDLGLSLDEAIKE